MTDNQSLFSNVHHLKSNTDDYRLQTDVLSIRQSIEVDKIAQELRYCMSEENIADSLTKSSKSSHLLMSIVRTGVFNLPGGTSVREGTMNAVRTWSQLMQAEAQVKSANKSGDKKAENSKVPTVSSKTLIVKQLEEEVVKNPEAQKQRTKNKENFVKSQQFLEPDTVKTPCPRNNTTQAREADIARYREKICQSMRSLQGKPASQPAVFSGLTLPTKLTIELPYGDVWGFDSP